MKILESSPIIYDISAVPSVRTRDKKAEINSAFFVDILTYTCYTVIVSRQKVINKKQQNFMVKEYLIPVTIVVVGLIVYNMFVKKLLPDSFDGTVNS